MGIEFVENERRNQFFSYEIRTSYSGACVLGYQVEAGGVECHGCLAVPSFYHSRVPQVAVVIVADVRG